MSGVHRRVDVVSMYGVYFLDLEEAFDVFQQIGLDIFTEEQREKLRENGEVYLPTLDLEIMCRNISDVGDDTGVILGVDVTAADLCYAPTLYHNMIDKIDKLFGEGLNASFHLEIYSY